MEGKNVGDVSFLKKKILTFYCVSKKVVTKCNDAQIKAFILLKYGAHSSKHIICGGVEAFVYTAWATLTIVEAA